MDSRNNPSENSQQDNASDNRASPQGLPQMLHQWGAVNPSPIYPTREVGLHQQPQQQSLTAGDASRLRHSFVPTLPRMDESINRNEQKAYSFKSNSTAMGNATATAAAPDTKPTEIEKSGRTSDVVVQSRSEFPKILFNVLQEAKYLKVMGWSRDGKAFYLNQNQSEMKTVLSKYFNVSAFSSFYRYLETNGWTKLQKGQNANMMYNPHFHKNMADKDFEAMFDSHFSRQKNSSNDSQTTSKKHPETKNKKEKKVAVAKKAGATVAKKKIDNVAKKKNDKAQKTAAATKVGKSKAAAKTAATGTQSSNNKKRKKTSNVQASTSKNKATKKEPSVTKLDEAKMVKKRLREHKKLHELFTQWNMWNLPEGLDVFLRSGKVHAIRKKTQKTDVVEAADAEPEMGDDCTQDQINALLCHEELPQSVMDNTSDSQALADLVERIRQDRVQQRKFNEILASTVAPNVKGKRLRQSQFVNPKKKWKKVRVGDWLGVHWRDNKTLCKAIVQKQQGNTSYFQMRCEADGSKEWFDLSRERFQSYGSRQNPEPVARFHTQLATMSSISSVTDNTPQKDNRTRGKKDEPEKLDLSIDMPDYYSHLGPFVRYSWKGLGLGRKVGTPSYNDYIRKRDPSAPEVTTLEILNDLRLLGRQGLMGVLGSQDEINNIDTTRNRNNALFNQLNNLRDEISTKHKAISATKQFDQTLNGVRKVTEKWNIPTLRKNLRIIETQILDLDEKETTIIMKCKEKGLW